MPSSSGVPSYKKGLVRRFLASVVPVGAFALIAAAAAASLGGISAPSLGAEDQVVASCDQDGIATDYSSTYDPLAGKYMVTSVLLSDVAPACNGEGYAVTLAYQDQQPIQEATGTLSVSAGEATIPVSPSIDPVEVHRIAVLITSDLDSQTIFLPNQPSVSAAPTPGGADLTWTVATPPNRPIAGFRVYQGPTLIATLPSGDRDYSVTGLTNGTSYTFTVRPFNAQGTPSPASPSASASVTPVALPAAPATPTGVVASGQVTLGWSATGSGSPSAPISSVALTRCEDAGMTASCVTTETTTSSTGEVVSGLTNGTTYYFRLASTNASGTTQGAVSAGLTPFTAPLAPAAPFVTPSPAQVALSWTAIGPGTPANPNTSVAVLRCTNLAMTAGCVTVGPLATSTSSTSATGLTNGTTYYFQLIATNAVGSTSGLVASATPVAPPPALAAPSSVPGNGQVTLTWPAPGTGTVAAPIVSVALQRCTDAAFTANCVSTPVATSSTGIVSAGLTNGTSYFFRLRSTNGSGTTNGVGTSAIVPISLPVAPASAPTMAVGVTSGTAAGTWTAIGAGTVAAPNTSVAMRRCTDAAMTTGCVTGSALAVSSTTQAATGLTNGTLYYFAVVAINGVGSTIGPVASATPYGAPATLAAPTRTAGNAQITLTWTAPGTGTAAAPIVSVALQRCTDAAMTIGCVTTAHTTASTGTVVTGLTNGTAYYFRLRATNTVGTTSGTTTAATTPIAAPLTPTAVLTPTVGVTSATASFTWTATGAGPAATPNTSVAIRRCTNAAMTTSCTTGTSLVPTSSSFNYTGLTNGTTYYFRLRATNSVGFADGPVTAAVTPYGPPVARSAPTRVVGNTQVTLTWTAPGSGTAAAPVVSFALQRCENAAMTLNCATTSHATASTGTVVTGLTNGVTYYFRNTATNSVGTTNGTVTAGTVPIAPPATPPTPSTVATPSAVALSWTTVGPGPVSAPVSNLQVLRCTNLAMTTGCVTSSLLSNVTTSSSQTGLTNGTTYFFQLRAINAVGTTSSAVVSATPVGLPPLLAAPTGVVGVGQVTLSWAAPGTGTAASPIVSVALQRCLDPGMTFGCTSSAISTASTGTLVTGLTSGTSYFFRLGATNASGTTNGTTSLARVPL